SSSSTTGTSAGAVCQYFAFAGRKSRRGGLSSPNRSASLRRRFSMAACVNAVTRTRNGRPGSACAAAGPATAAATECVRAGPGGRPDRGGAWAADGVVGGPLARREAEAAGAARRRRPHLPRQRQRGRGLVRPAQQPQEQALVGAGPAAGAVLVLQELDDAVG